MFLIVYFLILGLFFILIPAIGFSVGRSRKKPWIGLIAGICLGWLGWQFFKMVMHNSTNMSNSSGLATILANLFLLALVGVPLFFFGMYMMKIMPKDARFVRGDNPAFDQHEPQQLYFSWGNQNDGIAIDLPSRKVYLARTGHGRWFDVAEIKHFGINQKGRGGDLYVLTRDLQYPEFLWAVYTNNFINTTYAQFERGMKIIGDFSTSR